MSAIFGIYYRDGRPVDRTDLEKMSSKLAHRGEDGSGLWCKDNFGLGHRMLWTTPESLSEKLPFSDLADNFTITADARIDNRDELIHALGIKGIPHNEISDSELILYSYKKWGESCPEKLIGDFAFAIWDARKKNLFCGRDPMGVRPFYYYRSDQIFTFSSEIKALLTLREVPKKLNDVKVADFLIPIFEDKVLTFYQNIFRLPPGNWMTVSLTKSKIKIYWDFSSFKEIRYASDEEYAEAFRDIFFESVRCRLRSAFLVGAQLSGGLDSSSIACTAAKIISKNGMEPLNTVTAVFPSVAKEDPNIDETFYSKTVIANGKYKPHFARADLADPISAVLSYKDEFIPAPSMYMDFELAKEAEKNNIRIVLSGWDGDTIIGYGYSYLEYLARKGDWQEFAETIKALINNIGGKPETYFYKYGADALSESLRTRKLASFARGINECSHNFDLTKIKIIQRLIKSNTKSHLVRFNKKFKKSILRKGIGWNRALGNDFAKKMKLKDRSDYFGKYFNSPISITKEGHRRAITSGSLQNGLEIHNQIASQHSIEQRFPFCDRRVIGFILSLPPEQALCGGWPRSILRRAMVNIIPREVGRRIGKGSNSANFSLKLLKNRKLIEDIIYKNNENIKRYIDIDRLQSAYNRFISIPMTSQTQDGLTIFQCVSFSLWLKQAGFN